MSDIMKSAETMPSIIDIDKNLGEAKSNLIMATWMNSFLDSFSIGGTMDAYQVVEAVRLIKKVYPHYIQEDFKLFFDYVRYSRLAEKIFRIDVEVIMGWLDKYDKLRDARAQEESINNSMKFKEKYHPESTEGVYFSEYIEIKKRAEAGDKEAIELLKPPSERRIS